MKFSDKVYALCRKIPKGRVSTYREISQALHTKAYRAVGNALRHNPYAPLVPCHRVIKSDGSVGGFRGKSSGKEIKEKIKLLEKEGVKVVNRKVDLKRYLFRF